MEERRTAAVVLSILALILLYFTVIQPYINLKKTHTLTFKGCTVSFNYIHAVDTLDDGYVSAQDKMGLCLCKVYNKQKPDTAIANQLMKIYRKYGSSVSPDSVSYSRYDKLDTVLKYRNKAFDTLIMYD